MEPFVGGARSSETLAEGAAVRTATVNVSGVPELVAKETTPCLALAANGAVVAENEELSIAVDVA